MMFTGVSARGHSDNIVAPISKCHPNKTNNSKSFKPNSLSFVPTNPILATPSSFYSLQSIVLSMRRNTLKVKFTPEEDSHLFTLVEKYGTKDWTTIANYMQTRNARQCRERWNNYVNPNLRTEPWSEDEDQILEEKYEEYGARWNKIAKFLKNRSDNNIRNRWMMISRKKSKIMISPISPLSPPNSESLMLAEKREHVCCLSSTNTCDIKNSDNMFGRKIVENEEVKVIQSAEMQPAWSLPKDFFAEPTEDLTTENVLFGQNFECCDDWNQFF